jgi:hypothetical protein
MENNPSPVYEKGIKRLVTRMVGVRSCSPATLVTAMETIPAYTQNKTVYRKGKRGTLYVVFVLPVLRGRGGRFM